VFSDLHGDRLALDSVMSRIKEEQVSQILFAGDMGLERLGTYQASLKSLGIPLCMVRGNCDSPWLYSHFGIRTPQLYCQFNFGNRIIFMTHGHLYHRWDSVPSSLTQADIFISGHTHRSELIHPEGEPLLINPGSVSSPRDALPPTFATITHHEATIKILETGQVINQIEFSY